MQFFQNRNSIFEKNSATDSLQLTYNLFTRIEKELLCYNENLSTSCANFLDEIAELEGQVNKDEDRIKDTKTSITIKSDEIEERQKSIQLNYNNVSIKRRQKGMLQAQRPGRIVGIAVGVGLLALSSVTLGATLGQV